MVVFLIWLLMMVFAHDFVAERITTDNDRQFEAIQAGNHDFEINSLSDDDVVDSFQQHWQHQDDGLFSLTEQPEISIDLDGFKVQPTIHQTIQVDAELEQGQHGVFKIEFSNQLEQVYYDSNEISLGRLSDEIDLKKLKWTENNTVDSNDGKIPILWANMGQIDAWVMRFYLKPAAVIKLNAVTISQVNVLNPVTLQLVDCKQERAELFDCHVNNHMRYLNHDGSQLEKSKYSFNQIFPMSPWVLVMLAWVLTSLLVYKLSKPRVFTYVLVSTIFTALLILHQDWVVEIAGFFKWFLLLAVLALVWVQRSVLLKKQKMAWPVWIISVILALLMLTFGSFDAELLTLMPMYFLWACVQQLLLGPVYSEYFKRHLKTSNILTACLVAVLFSIIHSPNHVLMLATLVSGVAWSYAWLKYENIYANAFSHALLALVFYQVMPEAWLGSARIGVFF